MSYVTPSVNVYQQLAGNGGATSTTPDLDTCIIGPAYNLLRYVGGSAASQIKTAAISAVKTTGSMAADSTQVTGVVAPGGFAVGDEITVIGAGDTGANLVTTIVTVAGNVFTVADAAKTAVSGATVAKTGKITNAGINNIFNLPGQKPGQVVDVSSIVPWLDNVVVRTAQTGFYGYYGNSVITNNTPSGVTGGINSGASTLTIGSAAMATQWAIGDVLTVAGAGAAGGLYTGTVTNISGTTFTVTPAAATTVAGAAVNKVSVVNQNSTTNTLRAEVGDAVSISYTSLAGVASTFVSTVKSLVTSSSFNGTFVNFGLNDTLPMDMSTVATTGTMSAASTTLVVASNAGLSTNDTVQVFGAGPSGGMLETTISGISGVNVTLAAAATTTVTGAVVAKVLRSTGGISGGATVVQLVTGAASHFSVGDRIVIVGAGANSSDHVAKITAVAAPNITIDVPTITATGVATYVRKVSNFQLSTLKTYQDQAVAATKPISGGANFSTANTLDDGTVQINAGVELVYGPVVTGDVYFAYRALRTDLSGTINEFNDVSDVEGLLGDITDENPLALGLQIALANTNSRIFGIGVSSDDLTGHEEAMSLLENHRMYSLVPLTQATDIISAYQVHVDLMSEPEQGAWRIVWANTAIPVTKAIGTPKASAPNLNGGGNNVAIISGDYVLSSSNSTFVSDGVVPGDTVHVVAASNGSLVGTWEVLEVVNNQQLKINTTIATTAVSFYVTRSMTKDQQAIDVAAASSTFGDSRVIHVQPDSIGISVEGVTTYLPGYYLCCAFGGLTAGFPVQQGFTNIGVAGIADLQHSNFYFSKANLDTMAASGTFLVVQATQGGIPYVRHAMTTDMSALEYREVLIRKNWDFLSYTFADELKTYIGRYNITTDTLNSVRQTIISKVELLKSKKLPKIGAPLVDGTITLLEQNKTSKDRVTCKMNTAMVYPFNYLDLYLIV
jgi:hypothetical protein